MIPGGSAGVPIDLPGDVWFKWRILTSADLKVTLHEFETEWSMFDALEAHQVLDELDYARRLANHNAEKEARRK